MTVGPRTTIDIAYEEQLPIGLVQDMLDEVEEAGDVCRDEGEEKIGGVVNLSLNGGGGQEIYWWVNVFQSYVWDGENE